MTNDREQQLAKYRRYLDRPLSDPWNWFIVIGVSVVCALPLLVAAVMLP